MRGRYKVVNKFRFSASLLIGIAILSTFAYAGNSFIKSPKIDKTKEFLSNFEEVKVYIEEGDRSWVIQQNLTPNHDTREMLFFSGLLNEVDLGNIRPGMILTFLREKEHS